MTRDEIANLLDGILDKELGNLDIPSASDWENIEKKFGCQFPSEFKFFIELMSEYSFPGDILNVSNGNTNGNDTIEFTYDYEIDTIVFFDRHGLVGESQRIATSFTDLLERLIKNKGQYWYWLRSDFISLGDAYDD
ncbi:SMI1/KNR4 family protein [Gracilibacillus suaedae]|uniref:SMI1/KNR4 family protein n=1 Tax=Gracilibacillus suaedae TaxID=2820273 RepID=UPI002F3F9F89